MLRRRLQVLIDDERYDALQRESARSGAPVGELVRRAIDREYRIRPDRRIEAADYLLGLPRSPGREPDWDDQKRRLLDEVDADLYLE